MPRFKRSKAGKPLYNHYRCHDGKWLALGMMQASRFWPDFCRMMGLEALEHDPKFSTIDARMDHAEELVSILDRHFATRPRDEWLRVLQANPDFFCGPINDLADLPQDPQVLANDYIIEYDHPAHGRVKATGFPIGLSETPAAVKLPPPEFGQHTEEILKDLLGYSWEDIAKLKDQEVI